MLAEDWDSFDFRYILDLPKLVPHLIALESHRDATGAPVLPPHWLDPPEQRGGEATYGSGPAHSQSSSAWDWVHKRFVPGSAPISVADLLTLHRLTCEDSGIEAAHRGIFRTAAVRVGRPSAGGIHIGAPVEQVPGLMERYVAFLDTSSLRSLPLVIAALLGHFFLDTIHPFLDANGRTSRLTAAAILSQGGFRIHGSYAFIRHFYNHALTYHTLLQRSWQRCPFDVTAFIAFGIEGVIAELRSVEAFLRMKRSRTLDSEDVMSFMARRSSRRSRL